LSGLKIVILTSEFIPVMGGIGAYVLEIAKNLPKENEIVIIAPNNVNGAEILNDANLSDNISVRQIGHYDSSLANAVRFQYSCKKALKEVIQDFNPDIIHSQSTMPDLFVDPKEINIPIVTTIHSTIKGQNAALKNSKIGNSSLSLSERRTLMMGSFIHTLEKRYYKKRNHFITVSDYCANNFKRIWDKFNADILVIPNGVDTKVFNPNKKQESAYCEELARIDALKVLFLSRLVGIKGIDLFLDSIEKVNSRTKAHFIIAGHGDIKHLSAMGTKNITRLGHVPHEHASRLYAQSDIFVLPSYHENCPLSLLEAMSSGVAVIAANVGGVPEIIRNGENGIMINNDVKELTDAIVKLVEDPSLRRSMGSAARKTMEDNYSWKIAAEMTNSYYQRVIGS